MRTLRKAQTQRWRRATSFALLGLIVPMLLAACGGSSATSTPAATKPAATTGAATTASAAATTAPAAATSAPAAASAPAAGTTASSTTASASTTASGTTAVGSTTAGTGANLRGTGTKRGGGGTLHLLFWQAPTVLNVHIAQGTKDDDASAIVLETLGTISLKSATPDVPILAKEIPSTANGELAADGTSVTWKLLPGVKWSDGTPFTSDDVKATWQFIMKPENGATTSAAYANITSIDTPDPTTAKITFKGATPVWYAAFIGENGPVMQKAQIDKCTDVKNCDLINNPIGTGAYKVKSFTPGDNVQYVINDNFRDPNAPFFDTVDMKGGGDAGTAAKALQTGQVDFSWNLQVTPDILKQVTDAGKELNLTPGGGTERVLINFSDPNKDVNGEKSSPQAPHPAFTDPKVREALSWLMDRDAMAKNLYGPAGNATCNILPSVPPQTSSKNTTCGYDVAKANALLDQAGWMKGSDGIRAKNGVKMQFTFSTSVNAVREKEEQVMKQSFQQAGIVLDLKNADAGVFFGQPTNPDAASRFEKDLEMFTQSTGSPDSEAYFLNTFTTSQIAQKSNGWKGSNYARWSDPKFDDMVTQLGKELNSDKRAQLEVQLNDYLITNFVTLPLIDRSSVDGRRADLINTNPTPWDWNTWNIAYWQIKK
jgi:peptide/nickel transport system substrate-binding protein